MSFITVTFDVLSTGSTYGTLTIAYNDGNIDIPLPLAASGIVSGTGKFRKVPYMDGVSGENVFQALEYAAAFNRDYKDVGGAGNLTAVADDEIVTITSLKGRFPVGESEYTGDLLDVDFSSTNSSEGKGVNPSLTVELTGNGNCDTVEYSLVGSSGTPPYTLRQGTTILQSDWDGTEELLNISREVGQASFSLVDDDGLSNNVSVFVPRKLKIGEFKVRATQFIGYSDLIIENVNPVSNTTPIEYSLDPQGSVSGGAYQTSNAFPGILPEFYELFVKDKYGCVVTKTIQVFSYQDASQEQVPRYFDVPKGNAIIMSECMEFDKDVRPNYNNTLSFNELSHIRYDVTQYFDPSDFEPIHFKSNYPFHVATLHKSDGTKQDLPIVMVQENLGNKEKVDCKLFPIDGKTGVYFDGGNEYEPDTSTVIGASDYTEFAPSWAVEGQLVTLDTYGVFEIIELGYDSDLQREYFVIDLVTSSDTSDKIQVIWNIQIYNVFEAYVPFSNLDKGRVVIEKGHSFSQIEGRKWVSELLETRTVEKDDLLIEWSSTKNQSDIVFFSGVQFKKRTKGKFRAIFPNSSEIAEGDSRAYSLDQQFYQHYRLELDLLSAREIHHLLVASKTDGFKVNGESLVMKQEAEIEALGESNYYTFKCDYASGGNDSAIQPDSIALDSSTGLPGGGSTGKPAVPPTYDDKTRLNIGGGFITVGDEFISV